jgi:hypothetical protein
MRSETKIPAFIIFIHFNPIAAFLPMGKPPGDCLHLVALNIKGTEIAKKYCLIDEPYSHNEIITSRIRIKMWTQLEAKRRLGRIDLLMTLCTTSTGILAYSRAA